LSQIVNFARKNAFLIIAGLSLSGCAVNPSTYGTGQTTGGGFARDLGSIATFGLIEGADKREDITYRERSTLTIPAKEEYSVIPEPIKGDERKAYRARQAEQAAARKRLEEAELAAANAIDGASQDTLIAANGEADKAELANKVAAVEAKTAAADASTTAASDELPFKPKDASLFSRLGVSKVSDTARKSKGTLTEIPPEYRVIEDVPGAEIDPLAKKKKKKRFLVF